MKSAQSAINPFVLMLDPEAVISAMERSGNLRGLQQRICRPLDKPWLPKTHPVALVAGEAEDWDTAADGQGRHALH